MPENSKFEKRLSTPFLLITIFLISLIAGSFIGYSIGYLTFDGKFENLKTDVNAQLQEIASNGNYHVYQNFSSLLGENASLSDLYSQVQESVVVIRGVIVQQDMFRRVFYSQVQGFGFITQFEGQTYVVTNNHVVQNAVNITVTFTDGSGFASQVLGSDAYADLAVLSIEDFSGNYPTLEIAGSSGLSAGDYVIAVGSPYGLTGSVIVGVVSATGRTITEDLSGQVTIADVIQTSASINPGNSGGPLINLEGRVIGITTAIASDSQRLGFAIPSNTILREISTLIAAGKYEKHSAINAVGTDMTFEISQIMNTNITYGWLVVNSNEDNLQGGLRKELVSGTQMIVGGDIVTSINGVKITNTDDLLSYLEDKTVPGQEVNLSVIRDNAEIAITLTLSSAS